jgi:hypothetical protein
MFPIKKRLLVKEKYENYFKLIKKKKLNKLK